MANTDASASGQRGTRLVTVGCGKSFCYQRATTVVTWTPPGSQQDKAVCGEHTDYYRELTAAHSPQTVQIAEGTHTFIADGQGTQVGICRHCGHYIYLYFRVAGRVGNWWRGSEWDETGRCGDAEQRTGGWRVWHEPATTVEERDAALAATVCGRTERHALRDCQDTRAALAAAAEPVSEAQKLIADETAARARYERACEAAARAGGEVTAAAKALDKAASARREYAERAAAEAAAAVPIGAAGAASDQAT
ncbi:hypothetical protein [Verrucosispora sp. TAA-831]|uniref:hypothetical protein n=1 Tax=Verrucosispora sp. TAA-831 TaxID=3422227 RepID=UPI003D6F6367